MKPIIRFRQYNKEWRPFKLNTILVPSNEKNTKGLYSKNDVLSVSGEAGIVNQIAFQGRSFAGASVLNYGVVNTNDIVYTKSPLRNNPYGIIKTNNGPSGIVSTLYAIYNCCEESCPQFVDTYFTSSSRTNNYLRPLVRKGAKNDMKVSSEGALQGNVIFPYKDEQIEIASYFRTLDAKLQASAKKVESLKKLKSASLVAMFPQNGESTPKVRFKGFEGEWKKVKLGNVCSVNRGTRITKKELNTNQSYPVYQNTNYPLGYYKNYNVEANNPYVIIGGSAGLIGFSNVPFWAADDCAYFGDNDSLDKAFLYSTLLSHIAEIKKNVRGSSVPRLDRSTLIDLEINLPSFSEQQAIATFFRSLDRKIALETARLEKLKQIKLACLDKMFV